MVGIRVTRNYPSDHLVLVLWDSLLFPTDSGHHCNEGGLQEKIGTVHRGREDTRRYQTYVGLISGCGTGDRVIRR